MSAATSINEDENCCLLCGFDHILKLPVSRDRRFKPGRNSGSGFEEAQQQTALDRVIHILRQRARSLAASAAAAFIVGVYALACSPADPTSQSLNSNLARLHRHADLKIARVIRRARPAWPKPLTLRMKTDCTGPRPGSAPKPPGAPGSRRPVGSQKPEPAGETPALPGNVRTRFIRG